MSKKHQEDINPNAAAEQLKSMLSGLGQMSEKFSSLVSDVDKFTVKERKKFFLNKKEGEVCIAKNNVITISLHDSNESDVKEIIRRLMRE